MPSTEQQSSPVSLDEEKMFLGILIYIYIDMFLKFIVPPCLFFGIFFWAIKSRKKIFLVFFGITFLAFFSTFLWSSFSLYNLRKAYENAPMGHIVHIQSVRLVLQPEKDLICDNFCLQLLDQGQFEKLIIQTRNDLSQAYELGRGTECMPQLQRMTPKFDSERSDKSWALRPNSINYARRLDICALPVADNSVYQASIYLDKLPDVAPWISQTGHSIVITEGSGSEEKIISEAYKLNYAYPAPIPIPYISCRRTSARYWGTCEDSDFVYLEVESDFSHNEIEHLIADTFGFSDQPAENPNEAIANYNDVKSLLLDGLSQKEFKSVSTTLLYYARKNTFFPDETLQLFSDRWIDPTLLELARQSENPDAQTLLKAAIPLILDRITEAHNRSIGPDRNAICSNIDILIANYAKRPEELRGYSEQIIHQLSDYIENCSRGISSQQQEASLLKDALMTKQ